MCIDVFHTSRVVVDRIQIGIKGFVAFTCRATDFTLEIRLFAERIFHRQVVFRATASGFVVLRLHATSNELRVMQWARPFQDGERGRNMADVTERERFRSSGAASIAGASRQGIIVSGVSSFRIDRMPYGGVNHSGFGREGLR